MKAKAVSTSHKLQIITLIVASAALVLAAAALWQGFSEREMRLLSEKTQANAYIDQAMRISRLEMCIEQNISPCNLSDTTQPVDLSPEK